MKEPNNIEDLIKIKEMIKRKKPKFVMQDSHKKAKLKDRWRKPRGKQSKMRLQKKGYRKIVKIGYGKPLKGYINGKKPYYIRSKKDFDDFIKNIKNKDKYILILNSNFGKRTLLPILESCLENNIKVHNFNVKKKIEEIRRFIEERKKRKEEEKKEKEREKEKEKEEEKKKIKTEKETDKEDKEKKSKQKDEEKIKKMVEKTTPETS